MKINTSTILAVFFLLMAQSSPAQNIKFTPTTSPNSPTYQAKNELSSQMDLLLLKTRNNKISKAQGNAYLIDIDNLHSELLKLIRNNPDHELTATQWNAFKTKLAVLRKNIEK